MFFRLILLLCMTCMEVTAITKDTATTRCAMDIKLLKQARMSFPDKDVDSIFQKIIAFLETNLSSLEKAEDVKDIALLRQQCGRGFKTARFFAEIFGGKSLASQDEEGVKTTTPPPTPPSSSTILPPKDEHHVQNDNSKKE